MNLSTDVIEQMRVQFTAEALDLLIELDSALLSLEAEPGDSSLVHRVFRAIHTIKGSGRPQVSSTSPSSLTRSKRPLTWLEKDAWLLLRT